MQVKYKGFTITVNDGMMFCVAGGDIDETFKTGDEAKAAIDHFIASTHKAAQANMSIPVIVHRDRRIGMGQSLHVRNCVVGVHAGRGTLMLSDKTLDHDGADFYPDAPWISEALLRRDDLYAEADRIDKALNAFRIESRPGGYGRPKDVQAMIKIVTEQASSLAQRASKTTLQNELARASKK